MFGLSDYTLNTVQQLLSTYPEVDCAILFGSRAKGNYKKGSDIDIALVGSDESLSETVMNISSILNEELPIPYFFDVLNYYSIKNQDLKGHVDRVGIVIYQKNT